MKSAWLVFLLCTGMLAALPASAQTLHVVTEATAHVYMQDNKVAGPATEVLEQTLSVAGIKDYKLNIYPWARAYDMALTEPNVLIYLMARTPEREGQFQWVGEFLQVRYFLYKLKARSDVTVPDLEAARHYVIGVMRDDTRHQYLKREGFSRLVVSAQVLENFSQLLNRQVDMVPLSETGAAILCKQANFDCAGLEKVFPLDEATTGLYMAYSKGTPADLVARTQVAFDLLRRNGTVRRIMDAKPAAAKMTTPTTAPAPNGK